MPPQSPSSTPAQVKSRRNRQRSRAKKCSKAVGDGLVTHREQKVSEQTSPVKASPASPTEARPASLAKTSLGLPKSQAPASLKISKAIKDLGTELKAIPRFPVEHLSGAARVLDVNYVASYDWKEATEPTIIVPGSPRVWRDALTPPYALEPSTGQRYVDHNAHRLPSNPLTPLLDAADALEARLHWPDVDFILDHTVLLQLFGWARGAPHARDFRFDVERAGKGTALVQRWEHTYVQDIRGDRYEKAFTERATRPARGCQDSGGHFRVISYDFFGMRFVVRHEIGACLPGEGKVGLTPYECGSTPFSPADLARLWADPREPALRPVPNVVRGGHMVAQKSLIELAVRSEGYVEALDWAAVLSHVYLAGMPLLYVGVLRGSEVTEVRKVRLSLREVHERRDACAGKALEQLGRVLERIHDIVVDQGEKQLSFVCTEGTLKVFERNSGARFLRDGMYARFGEEGESGD